MASLLSALGGLCDDLGDGQHLPNARWIRDLLFGALASRSLQLSEVARALDEDARDGEPRALKHTHKRLDKRLNSTRWAYKDIERRHWERAAPVLKRDDGEGVVLAVDYTDLAKPHADLRPGRGQEDVCVCWNGSDGKKTPGYPVVQIEAQTAAGRRFPLALRVFSHKRKGYKSQNQEFLNAMSEVSEHVGSRAIWVMDRGFDSRAIFPGLDEGGPAGTPLRWAVRLKLGKVARTVITAKGELMSAHDAALAAIPRYCTEVQSGRGRKRKTFKLEIGARTVYTTASNGKKDGPARTLIVVWGFADKDKEPLVILASERLSGKAAVMEYVRAYRTRWSAELGNRLIKASQGWGLNLEKSLQVLNFEAVRRVVLLVAIAQSILSEIGAEEHLAKRALRLLGTLGRKPKDISYQIARGVGELLLRMRRSIVEEWREDVERGFG